MCVCIVVSLPSPLFLTKPDTDTHTFIHTYIYRIPLRGLEFPYAFELTVDNLLFPQTKETWIKDNRAFDDLGISALLDLDGKFSTANENDLIGFGISKPVAIAGSQVCMCTCVCVCVCACVCVCVWCDHKEYVDREARKIALSHTLTRVSQSPYMNRSAAMLSLLCLHARV